MPDISSNGAGLDRTERFTLSRREFLRGSLLVIVAFAVDCINRITSRFRRFTKRGALLSSEETSENIPDHETGRIVMKLNQDQIAMLHRNLEKRKTKGRK